MSVTVRRRVARFDVGGTVAPSSPLLGNPSSGSSGATPSATPTPASTPGSFGGGMAIGAGPSAASYTPGSGGTWSNGDNGAIPQQSDGITATAQGLPAATAKQGQYSAGPQSSQAGSWGGAATNPSGAAVTGQQNNSGTYTPYTPGSYQRAGTAGNYGAYQVAPTAPAAPAAPAPAMALASVASGGAIPAPSMAEGGAVKNYAGAGSISFISHKGRHGGGGMTESQANNAAYNAQEERQNEQLAQQSHQHDMQDESQLVPGSFQKKSSQQAAPQKQQSQKPQRAAGPSSNQQATQQMQSSANQLENSLLGQQRQRDNTQMQSLQKEMNQGASPNGSSGTDPSQNSGQSTPDTPDPMDNVDPQQTSPNTPDSSGEAPADNSASDGSASAGGMRKGGPVKFDDGGAVPAPATAAPDPSQETTAGAFTTGGAVPAKFGSIAAGGTPTTGGHPATAGVKAAFSHARKMNGLNDQVFQQMASGLSGMQQKMEDGGAVENPDDPDGVQVGADDDDSDTGFAGGGAVPTPADTEVDNQEGPSNDPMDNEADRQQEAQADNALQAAGDPAGAEGTNFLKAAARSDPALKNEAAFPGNAG